MAKSKKVKKVKGELEVPEVSKSNLKAEIYDAYQEIVDQVEELEAQAESTSDKPKREEVEVKETGEIMQHITKFKVDVNEKISSIQDSLVKESERLKEIKEEIESKRNELEDIHEIKINADTLKNFLKVKAETEKKLEQELEEKEEEIAKRKAKLEDEMEEYLTEKKKELDREAEEYEYKIKKDRREEEEKYQAKIKEKEDELSEREEAIKEQEDELEELRNKVEEFDKILDKEVTDAVKDAVAKTRLDLENKFNLERKEIEGDKKVSDTELSNFKSIIEKQEDEIKSLRNQLSKVTDQMKDMAVSAIGGKENRREDSTKDLDKKEE